MHGKVSFTVAPAENDTVPKIESRKTSLVGDQPVNCNALSFKVLNFRILYRTLMALECECVQLHKWKSTMMLELA